VNLTQLRKKENRDSSKRSESNGDTNNLGIYTMEEVFLFPFRTFPVWNQRKVSLLLSQIVQNIKVNIKSFQALKSIKSTFRMLVSLIFTACRRIVAVKQPGKIIARNRNRRREREQKRHFYSKDRKWVARAFGASIHTEADSAA